MHKLVESKGSLINEEVVKKSREIDKLLNEYAEILKKGEVNNSLRIGE